MGTPWLRQPKNVLLVALTVITVVGVLPYFGLVNRHSCTLDVNSSAAPVLQPVEAFGLTVKTGQPEMTTDLRTAIAERLNARGFKTLVDNPVQKPRADLALESAALRWTPFYASAHTKLRVLVTEPRGAKLRTSEVLTIDGSCVGLIAFTPWRTDLIGRMADQAIQAIAGPQSSSLR
jgi:hypothetical protein